MSINDTGHNPELDSFDRALLAELRTVVTERAPAPTSRARRVRRPLALGGVAAAAVAAFGITTLNPTAAYAVDRTGNGDIVITIHRLDDADGLEQALADNGIAAHVDYEASGATTAPVDPQALQPGDVVEGHTASGGTLVGDPGDLADSPCGNFESMPLTTDLRDDEFVITIPKDSVLTDQDSVLEINTTGDIEQSFAGLDVSYTVDGVECGFGSVTASAVPAG